MPPQARSTTTPQERRGLWLGLAGVAIFALTLPMTRLAVGTAQVPLMSGMFVALGAPASPRCCPSSSCWRRARRGRDGRTGGRWC
jgi:hypothetical protein